MSGQRKGPRRPSGWQSWLSNDLLVRAPQHRKRALVLILGLFLIGWGCLCAIIYLPPNVWYRGFFSAVLGVHIGLGIMSVWKKQHAYRMGWIHGRTAMVRALREAGERGMNIHEWHEAEWHRDAALMGLDPQTGKPLKGRRKREPLRDGLGDGGGWRGWCVRRARGAWVHLRGRQRGADDAPQDSATGDRRADRQAP